jgi:hypothetical protein
LDNSAQPELEDIQTFINYTKSILRKVEPNIPEPEEQAYEESQPDLPPSLKTTKIPDMDNITAKDLISNLDFNPNLSKSQCQAFEKVILANHQAFSPDRRIGKYSDIWYPIKLVPDAKPISLPPYHTSPEKREAINKQINKWFSQGVIEHSDSPWGVPVIVVYQNRKACICIDYHKVNMVLLADKHPLLRQTNIMRALSGSQWLSTFNVLSGFQQIKIIPEHKHITALCTHKQHLQFTRLPFRLQNGPAVFQCIMNKVLAKFLWIFALVYIDDIVIYSTQFEDHLQHLNKVLNTIT